MVALDDQGLTQLEAFKKSMPISDGKGHYWDEALNGWRNDDGSVYDPNWQNKQVQNDQYFGNFDVGAAENLGSYQSQPETFSLGGSGFNSFNVANPDMDNNGLDDSTGWAVGVVRDIGSPSGYSYNGTPVTTNGAEWQGPVEPQQGSILGANFPQSPTPQAPVAPTTPPSNPWTYNAALASANPLAEPDPLASSFRATVRQPELLGQGYTGPDPRFPETPMLGNPAMGALGLYDRATNPVVETASQLLPSVITAGKYAPGIGGAVALGLGAADKLGFGYNPEENALKGLGQLGDSAKQAVQNPTNPLAFGEAQNEKFAERPLWQQIGGQIAFDPGNYIGGIGIGRKLGLIDDGTDFATDAIKAGKTLKGLTGADEVAGAADNVARLGGDIPQPVLMHGGFGAVDAPLVAVPKVAPELGIRPGSLLNPKGIDQLGDYTVKDALKVQGDLTREAGSVTNKLMADADQPFRVLGPTFKDADGNLFYKRIAPSQAEIDAGLPGALATRVIEKPGEYALTPIQVKAVNKIAEIESKVANERALFGVPVDKLALEEGDQYMHRLAVKPSTKKQVDALINEGADSVSLQSGGGGARLAGVKDKHRIYDDPIQAVKDGVVYANPKDALRDSVERNLKTAGDAHVKSLLTPFGQTAADRVSPALRAEVEKTKSIVKRLDGRIATAEKRAGIKSAEGDSLAVMLERGATGGNLALDAPTQDIRTVNNFIDRAQKRITAVRQKGGAYADEARALTDMLNDAKLTMADVMPKWDQAKDLARGVPLGRSTVRPDVAPALIGRDFTKNDAARINAYYSRGLRIGDTVINTNVPGVKAVNRVLVPLRAIGDASATFNQLAMAGVSHPKRFIENFGKVLRDSFDDEYYFKYLSANGDDAAKHGVGILGESGLQNDFQFGSWIERVPILKQTQKHFERFGNRMRIDGYNDLVDAAGRAGRPLDDAGKEAVAKSLNRVTGIANSRATDLESIMQFAPNFLRAHLEVIGAALSKGGIEGSLARQYVRNWAAVGTTLVAGVAMQQNRDLSEVLTPLDKKALKRGEIRLNPNFGTIRVAGQDVSVFGSYDSLARLATLGLDSMYRAGRDKDAMQLFDFVGYATSTKGSPMIQKLTDLIKGETFNGEAPLSLSALGKDVLPFTVSGAVEGIQQGKDTKDVAIDSALNFFGVKSNPETLTERLNNAAGGDFWGKNDEERDAILAANPDLAKEVSASDQRRLDKAINARDPQADKTIGFNELDKIKEERITSEGIAAQQYAKTSQGPRDAAALRENLDNIALATAAKTEQAGKDFNLFDGPPPTDPQKLALSQYYDTFDAAKLDGQNIDYEVLAAAQSKLQQEMDPALWDYVQSKLGLTKHDPRVQFIYDAKKTISDSGYWDIGDTVAEGMQLPLEGKSVDAYWAAQRKVIFDQVSAQADNPYMANQITDKIFDKIRTPYSKILSVQKKAFLAEHPDVAQALLDAGYSTSKIGELVAAANYTPTQPLDAVAR